MPTGCPARTPGRPCRSWSLPPRWAPAATARTLRLQTMGFCDFRVRFLRDGAEPAPSASPEAFAALIRAELARWVKVVREAGLKGE